MKSAIQFALRGYKRWISPLLPNACRFVPTCSEYAMEAVERHGALRGSWMAMARVLRCHPFARAGYDPVLPEIGNQLSSHDFLINPQALAGVVIGRIANVCGHLNSRAKAGDAKL